MPPCLRDVRQRGRVGVELDATDLQRDPGPTGNVHGDPAVGERADPNQRRRRGERHAIGKQVDPHRGSNRQDAGRRVAVDLPGVELNLHAGGEPRAPIPAIAIPAPAEARSDEGVVGARRHGRRQERAAGPPGMAKGPDLAGSGGSQVATASGLGGSNRGSLLVRPPDGEPEPRQATRAVRPRPARPLDAQPCRRAERHEKRTEGGHGIDLTRFEMCSRT